MTKLTQIILAGSMFCVASLPLAAGNEPIDPLTQKLHAEYGQAAYRAEWVNPLMPKAGTDVESVPSGDALLAQVVAQYTRETLDRGGWVNAHLSNSDYAVGNPLLFARIGEGVTVTAGG